MSDQDTKKTQKRILLVEDEPYIRELYVSILQPEGYIIDTAADGNDAYTKMYNNVYDLILLDILLPKMRGTDILKKLQKDGKTDIHKKVILITNLSQESAVAEGVTLGVRGYIVKSDYTPGQLLEEVKNNLAS